MGVQKILKWVLGLLSFVAPRICIAKQQHGNIVLYNNCRFPLYVEGVANITYLNTELGPQKSLNSPFRLTSNGTGSPLKVSTQWRSSRVTQIEYSACFGNKKDVDCHPLEMISYDLSKINDPSNTEFGVRIKPTLAECPTIECLANAYRCESTYYQPDDNYATKSCGVGTDLKVTFCPRSTE